jgi:hypothetical protein
VGAPLHEALKAVPEKDDDGKIVTDESGRPVTTVKMSAKALRHLVWIIKRADDPTFTAEDARSVRVGELELVAADDEAEAPKDEAEPVEAPSESDVTSA